MTNGSAAAGGAVRHRFDSALTPGQDLAYGALMVTSGTVSVLGNAAVLLMFHRRRARLETVEYLLYNLTVSTLLMMAVTCPLNAASAFSHRWIFDELGCVLHGALSFFCGLVNISALVSIGAIRYIKTCWAFTDSVNNARTPVRLLAAVYVWAAFWSSCPLLGWGRYGVEQHGLCCSLDWLPRTAGERCYIALAALAALFLPAGALVFFYWRIVVVVRRTQRHAGRGGARKAAAETQLHLVSAVLVLGFLLAWVPYAAVSLLGTFAGERLTGPGAVAVVTVLTKNSGWYNPAIYVLFSRQYRADLRAALRLPCWCRPPAALAQRHAPSAGRPPAPPALVSPASSHSGGGVSRNASVHVSMSPSTPAPRVCTQPGGARETSL
ncbi:opsin-5-like [Amphibalanus amphitrite]|uniref:opsin-5-like n=1 Tax=Amphibalanus amphitrite TaxID=1232801 RepID=UPI001C906A86|nr:opsin-5-like [Amphibalanus amphitrite]